MQSKNPEEERLVWQGFNDIKLIQQKDANQGSRTDHRTTTRGRFKTGKSASRKKNTNECC